MPDDLDDVWGRQNSLRTFGAGPQMRRTPFIDAADNLIAKALRAWDVDRDRAVGYITRAGQFPYDHDEQTFPALWAAHMALFMDVTDAAEDAEADDERWLDEAIIVLGDADEYGRIDLADVLRTVAKDWRLSPQEEKRIAASCRAIPEPEDVEGPRLSAEMVRDRARSVVAVAAAYRAALAE